MSFLSQFGFGRSRKTEDLERRVSRLQAALSHTSKVAGRWTAFRREVTGAIAVLMLALGFSSGLPFLLVFSTQSVWLREAGI